MRMRTQLRRTLRRAFIPLAVVTAVVCPATLAASAWLVGRAAPRTFRDVATTPARTVAIVPGALVYAHGEPSPVLEDRLESARALYAAGRVRRILVSGDHAHDGYDEVNAMHRWLVTHGVPSDDVFLDHAGLRTLDTMVRAAEVFRVRDAIVCTQAFHLPRALFLAEYAGIDAVGFVSDRRTYLSRRVDAARELFARSRAVTDRYVLHTRPRYLGSAMPIDGPASATHDSATTARP
jgi:SanA protein